MDPKLNTVKITPGASGLEDSRSRKPMESQPFPSPNSVFSVPGCVIMDTLALKVMGNKKHFQSSEEWAHMCAHILSDAHQRLSVETTKNQPEMPARRNSLMAQKQNFSLAKIPPPSPSSEKIPAGAPNALAI